MPRATPSPRDHAQPTKDGLLRSDPGLECLETRLSWILMAGSEAWKLHKAVHAVSDQEDELTARRRACERELARAPLHAPGVYLGLVPITRRPDGGLRLGGEGEIVDWSIHMRRLPERDRADRRVEAGRLGDEDIQHIAEHLAAAHASAAVDAKVASYVTPEIIAVRIGWAFGRGDHLAPADIAAAGLHHVEAWQRRFVNRHGDLLERRREAGRIRDGHGDFCLENVYVGDDGRVAAVDGAKRDLAFRLADVAADVATFSLDLALHGRTDLAERFIAAYALAADDFDLYSVIDFYESCRASLEAGSADRLRADPNASPALRERAGERAVRYTRAALAFGRRPFLPPMLVALSGLVATGKSSVGAAIARQIAAPIVSADATRDFMLYESGGEDALHEADWVRHFRPGFREDVYDEVFLRAECVLTSGRPVVIDGCFGTRTQRARARALAQHFDVPFFFVECTAEPEVLAARLREREREAGLPIDAWQRIAEDFRGRWEPVDELSEGEHVVVDTGRPLAETVRLLEAHLPVWPEELN
jgi:aminoglycoside phosphotransferase family enzyme/predicted kinase